MNNYKFHLCFFSVLLLTVLPLTAQHLAKIISNPKSALEISGFEGDDGSIHAAYHPIPLVSYEICLKNALSNKEFHSTSSIDQAKRADKKIEIAVQYVSGFKPGLKAVITFQNISKDTLWLTNVVPFGFSEDKVCLTGKGDHALSRSYLFRPGFTPVNCILPDNAWESGFSNLPLKNGCQVASLTRRIRDNMIKSVRHRFETEMAPGGVVQYLFYADFNLGNWQDGLRMIFQSRLMYDVEPGKFDDSLFQREDLGWIRHAYVSHLMMAWNQNFYDGVDSKFYLEEFARRGKKLYGGDDFIGIWPTWPTLGVDQRNQWDLFRDLPGGTTQLRIEADKLKKLGSRLFICYNPWDESTRIENAAKGMATLVAATNADGVVLDTRGASSKELQQAADSVRKGVVMYSEGMAVPKDMQGIVAGRVHNALYYCPMLNLNKIIKPDFAIFRVAEIYKEPIRREFCLSFFNGYGTELNIFAPGVPEWAEEQYKFLGRIAMLQRQNSDIFTVKEITPLMPTTRDQIWVNKWQEPQKTLYTIYGLVPEGYKGNLFEVNPTPHTHFVDLWHHNELTAFEKEGAWMILAETDAFNQSLLGSNNEGAVDCIAQLPEMLAVVIKGDELSVEVKGGDSLKIFAGNPDYQKVFLSLKAGKQIVKLTEHFGRFEGKFVVQLFDKGQLLDERVVSILPGTPRLVSSVVRTETAAKLPKEMVRIPAGKFTFHATNGDKFIPYPQDNEGKTFAMPSFWMDRFPVTNKQFKIFLLNAAYQPADTSNYLKNWINGTFPEGEEQFPVVYISYEDARAYAKWVGKRLPTEVEWQYAAQTEAGNEWPWKQKKPILRAEESVTSTLTVFKIKGIEPGFCNPGNGKPEPVGHNPKGANPFGLQDLVGSVWQLTNDLYANGSYCYVIMKGGSYFNPSSSWWYVQGGPRELHYRQFLLRVSEGFERNATVGFRCVKDAD